MKKALILMAVVAVFAMTGCSKSKTCNCKTTQNIPGVGPTVTNTTLTVEDGNCSSANSTSTTTINGMTVTTTIECSEQ